MAFGSGVCYARICKPHIHKCYHNAILYNVICIYLNRCKLHLPVKREWRLSCLVIVTCLHQGVCQATSLKFQQSPSCASVSSCAYACTHKYTDVDKSVYIVQTILMCTYGICVCLYTCTYVRNVVSTSTPFNVDYLTYIPPLPRPSHTTVAD